MFIQNFVPGTPVRRGMKTVSFFFVKNKNKNLSKNNVKNTSRNLKGNIIVRHRLKKNKSFFTAINYTRLHTTGFACVLSFSKLGFKKPFLALIKYTTGIISYIMAAHGLFFGSVIRFIHSLSTLQKKTVGNLLKILFLKQGDIFFNLFSNNNNKVIFSKSAGSFCKILYRTIDRDFFVILLPSGFKKKISIQNFVVFGRLSNVNHRFEVIGSAGFNRRLGFRPTVRGVAMNPVDHPHGGRTKTNQPEVSPWG
jgi:large subunit ribosomal protein L2